MQVILFQLYEAPPGLLAWLLQTLPPPWFGLQVECLSLPPRLGWDAFRQQVNALELLQAFPPASPHQVLLGVTDQDLFLPALAYVFGLSPLGERRALISLARLREGNSTGQVLRHRLLVESLHELGHSVGLVHCPLVDCAMHRSLWVEGVDLKKPSYCSACWRKLGEKLSGQP